MKKRFTGTVIINATTSDTARLSQNSAVSRLALMAPGTSNINILSTASIETIELVSVAIAARTALPKVSPWRISDHEVSK